MEIKRIGYLSWNNTERVIRYLENGYTIPEIARTINVPVIDLYDFIQRRYAEKEIIKEQERIKKQEEKTKTFSTMKEAMEKAIERKRSKKV